MALQWIREEPAVWDSERRRIIEGAPSGALSVKAGADGQIVPGDWWRVEQDGHVVGYGWMDHAWGDAEVLLAVAPDSQAHGIGTFILDRLEAEAATRGINYLYNVIPAGHPRKGHLKHWLMRRGFASSHDGSLLKRPVLSPDDESQDA